jgi:hypothetical protein
MTLCDFLDRVEGVYKSIDLRIAAAKAYGGIWHNCLTVVRFSCKEAQELEEQQKKLESQWGRVQTNNFRIKLQVFPFVVLDFLSEYFRDGKWLLQYPDEADVQFGQSVDLLSLEGRLTKDGYTVRNIDSWPYFEAFVGEHSLLLRNERLQSEVKSQTLFDLYPLIRELLEVDFSRDTQFDLIMAAPFYAHIEYCDFGEQRCKIQIKFHKDIKDLAVTATVRRGDQDNTLLKDKASFTIGLEQSEESGEYMRLWTREIELLNATPADYLWVNLIQTKPTGLDIERPSFPTQISRFLESKKPAKNPLLAAFRQFCSEDELESYLTKPGAIQPPSPKKPSSAFEGSVLWVLGLCGFQSVWLGWTEHETLKEGKIEHLRLDILAYYEKENTLLLVACTTGRPDQDIDIVNSIKQKLYAEVFKNTSTQIKGFIFSSQPSVDVAKQFGEKAGVKVFGAEDIRGILNYVREGDTARALSDYFGFPFKS